MFIFNESIKTMTSKWFYAVLPSNASMDTFPNNTLHSFKIKVPYALPSDEGEWCVGMSEIQFPSAWRNIVGGCVEVRFSNDTLPIVFTMSNGVYETISAVIDQVHKIIKHAELEKKIVLSYDKIRNSVTLVVKEDQKGFGISFSQNILEIFGLRRKPHEFYTSGVYTENSTDISRGFSALYVYADIVENRMVGDSMVPLLRVVPVVNKPKHKDTQWVRFHHIQYIPVVQGRSDIIEINIRRDNGEIVPFENGKVVITLHFQKQSS